MSGQPDDAAIAAWLEEHPEVLGEWLDRNPDWVRKWERVNGRTISGAVAQVQLQSPCACSYTWSSLSRTPVRIPCMQHAGEPVPEPPVITVHRGQYHEVP